MLLKEDVCPLEEAGCSLGGEARLVALRRCRLLNTEPEEAFDRITRLAARLLSAPVALVSLVEPHRQFFKSAVGLSEPAASERETPLSHSFCQHVVAREAPLVVEDAREHALVKDNPAVPDYDVVAYLGVPLRAPTGEVLGSLCVFDSEPRTWVEEDERALEDLAAVLTDELELRETVRRLDEEERRLKEEERAHATARALTEGSLDAVADMFFILDLDARLVRWNGPLGAVTGYADAELVGMRAGSFFVEEDRAAIQEAIARVYREGRAVVEVALRTKEGRQIPYEFNGTPLLDGDGRVVGLCGTARDISERKQAEEAVQESERFLRSTLDALSAHIAVVGEDGVIVAVNEAWRAFARANGADPEAVGVGADYFRACEAAGEEGAEVVAAVRDVLAGRRDAFEMKYACHSSEERRYFVLHVSRFDGGPRRVVVAHENVTDQRLAEEALRASEVRFRSFVETTAQVVWQADASGEVTELSHAWSAFTCQAPEELVGWGWTDALHPEDRARVLDEWSEHVAARTPYETVYRVRRHDGNYHRFRIRAVPVFGENAAVGEGALVGWVGTGTDVEEQRCAEEALQVSEQRLRLALEAVQMGTWDYDIRTGTVIRSARTLALLGVTEEPFDGPPSLPYPLLVEEDRARVGMAMEAAVQGAASGKGDGLNVEFRLPRPNGKLRTLRSTGRVHLGEAGVPERVTGILLDVTDEKAHEAALIEARDEAEAARAAAEAAARTKSALLSNMSHEIRTPLTSVIGFADILAEEVPEEHHEFAQFIAQAGRRLLDTLNSVLDLAQIEAGRHPLDLVEGDLRGVVAEVAGLLRPRAEAKGLAFEVVLPERPVLVRTDDGALGRIVTNLISNAVKFTDAGAVTVAVTTYGEEVEVRVADTGVGIAEAFLPYLFEEFHQESEGEARHFEGSGLGLTITKRLVEMLGGEIAVESAKGAGSTFTVRFATTPGRSRPTAPSV